MPNPLTLDTPSDREVRIVRSFEGPRELVFACYTRPELIKRWLLGPPGWTVQSCEMDARTGGRYRYVWRGPNGEDLAVSGTVTEIVPPEKLVSNESFDEDWTGGETLNTLVFTERDGRTTLAHTVLYSSLDARNGAMATGMTEGMEAGFQQLDALLAQGVSL